MKKDYRIIASTIKIKFAPQTENNINTTKANQQKEQCIKATKDINKGLGTRIIIQSSKLSNHSTTVYRTFNKCLENSITNTNDSKHARSINNKKQAAYVLTEPKVLSNLLRPYTTNLEDLADKISIQNNNLHHKKVSYQ